jgi:hypothetical protein
MARRKGHKNVKKKKKKKVSSQRQLVVKYRTTRINSSTKRRKFLIFSAIVGHLEYLKFNSSIVEHENN